MELKLRVYLPETGEMINVNEYDGDEYLFKISKDGISVEALMEIPFEGGGEIDVKYVWKEVKSVLMLFTGKQDSAGKDIYDKDIIQFSDKWEWYRGEFGGGFLASAKDKNEILNDHIKYPFERRVVDVPACYEWLLSREIQYHWEVIGNIHENKELLK